MSGYEDADKQKTVRKSAVKVRKHLQGLKEEEKQGQNKRVSKIQ